MRVYLYTQDMDKTEEVRAIRALGHHIVIDSTDNTDKDRKLLMSECDIVVLCTTYTPCHMLEWATECGLEVVGFWEFTEREKATTLKPVAEAVSHPSHYTFGEYEVIDVIEDWGLDFHLGNVLKYVARAGRKGDQKEDLLKAKWYLERFIEKMEVK